MKWDGTQDYPVYVINRKCDGKRLARFATPEIFAKALERAWVRRHDWKNMGILAHGRIAGLGNFETSKELIELMDEVAGFSRSPSFS